MKNLSKLSVSMAFARFDCVIALSSFEVSYGIDLGVRYARKSKLRVMMEWCERMQRRRVAMEFSIGILSRFR